MGLNADAVNKLKDILVTESGSGQPLAYLTNLYIGETDLVTSFTRPYMWVHLGDPAIAESWVAATNRREGLFQVLVEVAIAHGDSARPYGVTGDSSKRGFLVATEDVMNRIEANRVNFVAPNLTNSLDIDMSAKAMKNASNTWWTGVITLTFRQRFAAGGR